MAEVGEGRTVPSPGLVQVHPEGATAPWCPRGGRKQPEPEPKNETFIAQNKWSGEGTKPRSEQSKVLESKVPEPNSLPYTTRGQRRWQQAMPKAPVGALLSTSPSAGSQRLSAQGGKGREDLARRFVKGQLSCLIFSLGEQWLGGVTSSCSSMCGLLTPPLAWAGIVSPGLPGQRHASLGSQGLVPKPVPLVVRNS